MGIAVPMEADFRKAAMELARVTGASAVYLFGSAAQGRLGPDSDVDLAILTPCPVDPGVMYRARGMMLDRLGRPVDIVALRDASPIIAMQVLRKGRLLYDGSPGDTARFLMVTASRYEDLKLTRAPAERALRSRFVDGG